MGKFVSTMRKGFHITFENGLTASVQWGAGNYCDNHLPEDFDFSCSKPNSNEAAILVLAPGMNMNGEFFLKESPWMDFAKRNNLGVIALNYSSTEEDLYQNRKG